MDAIDRRILQNLKEDARASFTYIAKRVGLSEAAVRRRVRNLSASGVIKKFTIDTEVGHAANAIILVSVNPSVPTSQVSEKLRMIVGVETVYEITGQYDIAAIISGQSIAEINKGVEEIRNSKGVSNTNTMIVLKGFR